MFAYLGVDFEDKHYVAGPAPEFSREDWLKEKFDLGLDFPNLPYLIDGDIKLTETAAIMRYIAKKWGPHLLGSTAEETCRIEMLTAFCGELKSKSTMPCYMSDDKAALWEEIKPLVQKTVDALGNN